MQADQLRNILEAALLVAARPLSVAQLEALFNDDDKVPSRDAIRDALSALQDEYTDRGIELVEVASGWRMQSRQAMSPWIANLFQEKAPRYSRALLETLVLIAYRQPITRGEIEDVRGVAVNSYIIKTLIERDWVKVVGHRDIPGRPELLATTRGFLDYFNLRKIGDLPTLSEIKALEEIAPDLAAEVDMLSSAEAPGDDAESSSDTETPVDDADNTSSPETGQASGNDEDNSSAASTASVVTVDVELPPDADDTDECHSGEADAATDDEPADDELTINEATIDALSHVTRHETELLH